MKLKSCFVSSFGNLKDFSYDFTGGLNTVKQENGWGKSTFAAFIKSMFYGLNGSSKHGIDDNERKRYLPWNSTEKFGGYIIFEWDGKDYKIERFFGKQAADDTVKLYDLSTNKSYADGKAVEDLGKRIFSIDEEGFLSTTYFSQKDFEIKSNASITAKYNEVCEIEDTGALEKAQDKLNAEIGRLKMRGNKGRIADIKREIVTLDESMERTRQALKSVDSLKKDLEIVKSESDKISGEMNELAAKVDAASKREAISERKKRYLALKDELKIIDDKKAQAEAVTRGKVIDNQLIYDCEKCIRSLYDASSKVETLKADLSDYAPTISREDAGGDKPKNNIPAILFVLAAVFSVAGVVTTVISGLWGLALIAAGLIFGVFAILRLNGEKAKTLNEKKAEDRFTEIYERKKRELAAYEKTESELKSGLDGFFAGFGVATELTYERKLSAIKDAAARVGEYKLAAEKAEREIKELTELGVETDGETAESVERLNAKLKTTADWYKQKASDAERIQARIDALETQADSLTDAENKKAELLEELSESEKQLKILTLTAEFMEKADETLKTRYRAPLQESLNKYLKLITGREMSVSIDTDMKVTVNSAGAERETEFFSKGYRNLFEICKRFALTDILFTAEKPFVILDDPFCNLDDGKIAEALSLIKELSKEYQILYLVCHESRRA